MNENDSSTNETHDHPALAMENQAPIEYEDGEPGRWVRDPDDPAFEIWEPANGGESPELESDAVARGEVEDRESPTTPEAAAKWDAMLDQNESARCVAHKKSGERCRRLAIKGATVCRVHGGASGHVRKAARVRLDMAADRMAKKLLGIATDENIPPAVQLAATRDALDRAGLSAKTAVEVEVGPNKGFQDILNAMMAGGSRAESRSRRGVTDDPAQDDWIAQELAVVDAEVVDDPVASPARAASTALGRRKRLRDSNGRKVTHVTLR
ncbi:hypothetical protein VX037_17675 [Gordonia sp. Z-3]|uniref:hypothetical protein n=1 Tax=Gordonia sp. Z-3 TaxID=3115408 RepID=UPI002E2DD231|nr:hypothetical protein [Gordonia sp. Z-3]MED5802860.1 hypothetical protein [Gordonia sp. Z-3]